MKNNMIFAGKFSKMRVSMEREYVEIYRLSQDFGAILQERTGGSL
jgi:hypothetical protein